MDDLLREFLTETGEHLDTVDRELVRFEQCSGDQAILRNLFRLVHTIKGTCGFLGLPRLETLAHAAETLMGRFRDGAVPTTEAVSAILAAIDRIKALLVEIERLNGEPEGSDGDLIETLEAATARASLPPGSGSSVSASGAPAVRPTMGMPEAARAPEPPRAGPPADQGRRAPAPPAPIPPAPASRPNVQAQTIRVHIGTIEHLMTMVSELVLTRNQLLDVARRVDASEGYKVPLQRLSQVTAELQDSVMKTRMQPIGSAWAKLPRMLRDLAPELGKKVELVMSGAETELDRQVLELVRDPLLHMIRNAVDHGIEMPAARIAAGKPEHGTIRLQARNEGGAVTITISDDGGGLDLAAIGRRAVALGLAGEADLARMSDERIASFVFEPGFSTRPTVTAISGRGVGMDVVKANIDAIGGVVSLATQAGRGTTGTIEIPLTLAIMASLIVGVGDTRFALPQTSVVEVIRLGHGSEHRLEFIDAKPLLRVRDELLPVLRAATLMAMPSAKGAEDGFVAVIQVASRRFGLLLDAVLETEEIVVKPLSAKLRHIALFSGHTILGDGTVVLIIDPTGVARQLGHAASPAATEAPTTSETNGRVQKIGLLVFRGGPGFKAVPLSLVTRLEEVDAAEIETIGESPCLKYGGRLMPLVTLGWPLRAAGKQSLIVFQEGGRASALAIDEVVDIVEEAIEIEAVADRPDLIGSAIVRGRGTEIIDVGSVLPWLGGRADSSARTAPRVLLVDDQAFFRDLLGPVLRVAGFRVVTAGTIEEALKVLASGDIATLVTDLDLAGESGLDLIAQARRNPRLHALQIVALASSASADTLEQARDLDVFDVVAKFDRPGLIAALNEAAAPLERAA